MVDQVGGTHYQRLEYQTWDLIEDLHIDYFTGNIIKYISRYKNKNGNEDLKKAKSYAEKMIEDRIEIQIVDSKSLIKKYLSQFDEDTRMLLDLVFNKELDALIDLFRYVG